MRGLFVVGAGHGADEAAAAEAVVAALRAEGQEPAVATAVAGSDNGASPAVAASHAGGSIDPAAVVATVRDAGDGDRPLVVAAAGGLLAPLTPRYSVRDLAAEIGLPLVIAVPAGPAAVNLARLSIESARGAGLAVAAVALTRWPDPPDRVLLDERKLLAEVAPVPVVTLDGGKPWPAGDWLDAAPAGPGGGPAPPPVTLDPYREWESRPMGDPRSTPRPQIMAAMLEIVTAEGPMRAGRAYSLYNRAAGGKKLTSIARAPLSSAVYWLSRDGSLVLTKREDIPWQDDDLLRMPDSPAVHVRELGPRTLEEVPLDEIAELMRRLRPGAGAGEEALKRAVLNAYGLVRLTARADEYLGLALGLSS
jgi:dethiobiotin synthetase